MKRLFPLFFISLISVVGISQSKYQMIGTHSSTDPDPATSGGGCFQNSSLIAQIPTFAYSYDQNLLLDSNTRVLIGINWNLNVNNNNLPFNQGTGDVYMSLGSNVVINIFVDWLNGLDMMSDTSLIIAENGDTFNLAPLGGEGNVNLDCSLQTWNFFDITDHVTQTGQTGKEVLTPLGTPGTSHLTTSIQLANTPQNLRQFAIFLAEELPIDTTSSGGSSGGTSSLAENQSKLSFSLFPNPVDDLLNIDLRKKGVDEQISQNETISEYILIHIYDLSGKLLIEEEKLLEKGVLSVELNLPEGMYELVIYSSDYSIIHHSQRIIKN